MSGVSWCRTARRWPALLSLGVLLLALLPIPVATAQTDTAITIPCDGSTNADYNGACGPSLTLPRWSDAAAWNQPQYYETIMLADFDGDGADELLARSHSGFVISKWNKDYGQWVEQGTQMFPVGYGFTDAAGWDQERYYSTIQAAHLGYNGSSAASLLMLSATHILAFQWDGKQTWTALPLGPAWNWGDPSNYSTVQTWENWLIGRDVNGIQTWRFENGAWHQLAGAGGDIFANSVNGNLPEYYETIKLVELTGDSTPELVGRGPDGVEVYTWEGDSDWSYAGGTQPNPFPDDLWSQPQYYRTLMYGNIDGKAGDELLGRGPGGVEAYSWNGSNWDTLPVNTVVFADPAWAKPEYYETIQLVALDATQVVLTARGGAGLQSFTYDAANGTFNELSTGPALADGPNSTFPLWSQPAYYDTIHYGDVNRDGTAELVARGQYGVRTWSYDVASKSWGRPLAYGFQPYSDSGQQAAFELVNRFLNIDQGKFIRDWYTSLNSEVGQNYQNCLNFSLTTGQPQPPTQTCYLTPPEQPLANPGNVTAEQWSAMVKALQTEIAMAGDVDGFFNQSVSGLLNALFAGDDNALATIAQQLQIEQDANDNNAFSFFFNLLIGMVEAFGDLVEPELEVAIDSFATAFGAVDSLGAQSTSSFEGTLAEAQVELTKLNSQAIDNNTAFFQHVAQDYGLLYTVGTMVSDQTWLITADIQNALVSAGRRHFALWTYQLLLPTIWFISQGTCQPGSGGDCPSPDYLSAYILGPAGDGLDWTRGLYDKSDNLSVAGDDPALKRLFTAIQAGCFLGPDHQGVWSYATCNLGADRPALFKMQDGWKFECQGCSEGAVDGAPLIDDIQVAVTGSQVTLTVTARDPEGGPLEYRFDCAGGVIGPQASPSALCDFGQRAGEFTIRIEVTDGDGLRASHAVRAEILSFFCAAPRSGQVTYHTSPGCKRGERQLTLDSTSTLAFCVGERSGALQYAGTQPVNCGRGQWLLMLPEDGPITLCVGKRSRVARYAADAGGCNSRSDLVYVIANRVVN